MRRHRSGSYIRLGVTLILALSVTVFAACGRSDRASSATSASPGSGFPVAFQTRFGLVTVPHSPDRVVVLMDDEFVVALGVVPIAMAKGPYPTGVSDTVRAALGDHPLPQLIDVSAGYPYDRIATLEPDLIIGGVTQQDFDQLSRIAPTLAYEESATTESWQHRQLTIGAALGRTAQATILVREAEAAIDAIVAGAPAGLRGKTFSFALAFGQGQISAIRNSNEAVAKLLDEVGLRLAPGSQALSNPDGSGRVVLGLESLGELRADLAVVAGLDDSLVRQVTGNVTFIAAMPEGSGVVVLPFHLVAQLVRPSALTAAAALGRFVAAVRAQVARYS